MELNKNGRKLIDSDKNTDAHTWMTLWVILIIILAFFDMPDKAS